ncbi:hypothetical protein KIH74_23645 [Kineosporia sp. J2-2]|uniref:Tetratricopeptide repeat protein n=1 Tax=Kineosporia corallincola TaxID=2835133 RepID=A0ABS5TP34_9ACTN|nr:hypothetical protein [Kineosporia corallincola]MBT0771956.1 hypothetical protein [Kineosporia corallincola]
MVPGTEHAERHLNITRQASGALLSAESEASQEAAGNLLTKAAARLEAGDEARARHFVERALHLPYDDFEGIHPAVWWLEMEVSSHFSEEVELAPDGDQGWLDRAGVLLAEASDETVAAVIRAALNDVAAEFHLPRPEALRLSRLTAGEPFGREPLTELDDADRLADAVLGVLRTLNRQADLI